MSVRKATGTIRSNKSRSKRTSAVTWLVFIAMTIMAGMIFFMHSDATIVYQDLANAVKFSTQNIPMLHHSTEMSPGAETLNATDGKRQVDRPSHIEPVVIIPKPMPLRKKIAFAITITKDGPFHDGAAVMQYSIIKSFGDDDIDMSFVAFVHPNVTTSRPALRKIGYRCGFLSLQLTNNAELYFVNMLCCCLLYVGRVIEAPTPVNVSAIRGKFLRDHINDKAGCCGAAELIKLYSYR
jgi:hypothetical protein